MRFTKFFILVLALALTVPFVAGAPFDRRYDGAGIVVTSFNVVTQQITVLDNGAVICHATNGGSPADAGVGGNCLPFGALHTITSLNAIKVTDDSGSPVVFQVCVDNNGDGICKGLSDISDNYPMPQPPNCSFDSLFYSHSTSTTTNRAALFIPTWAQTFWQNCGGFGYPGYVVIVCAGVHNNNANTMPHTHSATKGTISPTGTTDLTSGNFCGAPTATKAYKLV